MWPSRLHLLPVTAPQTGQGGVPLVMTESRTLEGGGRREGGREEKEGGGRRKEGRGRREEGGGGRREEEGGGRREEEGGGRREEGGRSMGGGRGKERGRREWKERGGLHRSSPVCDHIYKYSMEDLRYFIMRMHDVNDILGR